MVARHVVVFFFGGWLLFFFGFQVLRVCNWFWYKKKKSFANDLWRFHRGSGVQNCWIFGTKINWCIVILCHQILQFQNCFLLMHYLNGLLVIFQIQFLKMGKNNCLNYKFIKLMSVDAVNRSNSIPHKSKNKATENCVIIVQYHQYQMFVYVYLCLINLLWLCKTKFWPFFSPSIGKHFIMTLNIVDVPLYMS